MTPYSGHGVLLTANGASGMTGLAGATGWEFASTAGMATPKNFAFNTLIDSNSNYNDYLNGESFFVMSGATSPDFNSGSYMGFRTGSSNYGWFEVTWSSAANQFQIHSGALESVANTPILAGDTGGSASVPEPGQVAASLLLLSGIGGYVFLKRRKAAKPALMPTAA
jgi:hypothetical protein